jgi:ERCC4-type nuclease
MIIIDSREPFDIQAIGDKVELLEYGDIKIIAHDKQIIIERKTPSDFWNSLKSGRLNEQLAGCDALVIYGPYGLLPFFQTDKDDGLSGTYRYVDALNGVSNHHIVWHASNIQHLKKMILRYEEQLYDNTFGKMRLFAKKSQLPVPVDILARFPGIGVEKATQLLEAYEDLEGVFGAAYDRLTIENIGEKSLGKIESALKEKPFKKE